ncbi:fatty acid desaturase family protein [Sphingomonas sp. PAMC 26605]|uniref:fatty acid desaturase family protein n=1 Tax=Sphingomonas sp. PAMC 26605 TaxID=1112214 RepID=UPI00026CA1AA|nr:fatty acid desaturase [Sphingomonas sp. PAMC 26605]
MNASISFDQRATAPTVAPRVPLSSIADDRAMLRTVAELTRDLNAPRPAIYWTDFLLSAGLGYAGLAVAMTTGSLALGLIAAVVAILGLYRAGSFIHEITHMRHASVPGFRLGWNLIAGVPLLVPSFMYEGVHNLHHARTRYGTVEDPEYLPLALMKPWTLPVFILTALLAPIALLFRFGVLSPVSLFVPGLRRTLIERYSSLAINPAFRRRLPEGEVARQMLLLEIACSVWAIVLIGVIGTGVLPLHQALIFGGILSVTYVLNQVRTLVAHLWENEGETMTVTAQYLDTVNVPPPAVLPVLWAPVGLRYHALHHLIPGVPYHGLAEAHRRLSAALAPESPYHKASYRGLPGLVSRLVRSTMGGRR